MVIGIGITTLSWFIVTLLTKPAEDEKLDSFYRLIHPGGPGWKKVIANSSKFGKQISPEKDSTNLPLGILSMFVGCVAVYGLLFATGYWLYANYLPAIILTIITITASIILFYLWQRLNNN